MRKKSEHVNGKFDETKECSKRRKDGENSNKKQNNKTPIVNPTLLAITWNIIGLNSSFKRHRVAEWIKKQDWTLY